MEIWASSQYSCYCQQSTATITSSHAGNILKCNGQLPHKQRGAAVRAVVNAAMAIASSPLCRTGQVSAQSDALLLSDSVRLWHGLFEKRHQQASVRARPVQSPVAVLCIVGRRQKKVREKTFRPFHNFTRATGSELLAAIVASFVCTRWITVHFGNGSRQKERIKAKHAWYLLVIKVSIFPFHARVFNLIFHLSFRQHFNLLL